MYVDSSLVKAKMSGYGLAPGGMTAAEFEEQSIEENGLFMVSETGVAGDGIGRQTTRYFRSPEGRMPLNPVDSGARWRTTKAGKTSEMQYEKGVIVDRGGFILTRGVAHASNRKSKPVSDLLDRFSLPPVSLAADTG